MGLVGISVNFVFPQWSLWSWEGGGPVGGGVPPPVLLQCTAILIFPLGNRAGVGCGVAAVPTVRQDTGCGSCSTLAAARVWLLQHPRGPSIGNGAGLAAVQMQCQNCCKAWAAAAAVCALQLECGCCSTPIAPCLVTGRGLAAVQLQSHSCGNTTGAAAAVRRLQPECGYSSAPIAPGW